jgi:hypothetical protein
LSGDLTPAVFKVYIPCVFVEAEAVRSRSRVDLGFLQERSVDPEFLGLKECIYLRADHFWILRRVKLIGVNVEATPRELPPKIKKIGTQ